MSATPRGTPITDAPGVLVGSDPEAVRELAVLRLKKGGGFKSHLIVYTVVNAFVRVIWLVIGLTSGGGNWSPWPIFMTLAWGLGLVLNGWDVYFRRPITEADVDAEIRRLGGAA